MNNIDTTSTGGLNDNLHPGETTQRDRPRPYSLGLRRRPTLPRALSPTARNTPARLVSGAEHPLGDPTSTIDGESHAHVGTSRVVGLAKWNGRVLEVGDQFFIAELTPIDDEEPTVTAEFDLDLLDAADSDALSPGTLFYLTVRTVSDRGRRERTSSIRVRRFGRWTEAEASAVKNDAERLRDDLADLWE
ncbi:hypothetical protein [Cryptosporangium aurantiacum]|uniref:Uncharacterized protein n=1 Tax=Cryptosporangium aurantiacum TaxID=134849 RepID=A0A1M7K2U8_9ACTN|nr:hypothetical protein [Cryptosporangium aurantiacum]SHM59147.1 hypothetical protein SAMN05443668_101974 [Cryptosporangium aurantiacum]